MAERIFDIPGDLPRYAALYGVGRPHPAARRRAIERRLAYIRMCCERDVVPDAKGRKIAPTTRGRRAWQAIETPKELDGRTKDLRAAVDAVAVLLAAGGTGAAGARMEGVEMLVREMARHVETGQPLRRAGQAGAEARAARERGRTDAEARKIGPAVEAAMAGGRRSLEGALIRTAREHSVSRSTIRRRWQRWTEIR